MKKRFKGPPPPEMLAAAAAGVRAITAMFNKLKSKKSMKFEIFQDADGRYRFRIKSGNNKVIAQSEGYNREWNAKRAIVALIQGIRGNNVKVRAEVK